MKDLSEHRLSSKLVYDGKLLKVRSDTVRLPDGGTAEREFIEHPGAVAVIALTHAGELVMERQYRYPLGRDMIEIPAGKIDPGEDPLATARRELPRQRPQAGGLEARRRGIPGGFHLAAHHRARLGARGEDHRLENRVRPALGGESPWRRMGRALSAL